MTQLIQKLKDNKKIVIGVSIGIIFLGKVLILVSYQLVNNDFFNMHIHVLYSTSYAC